VARSQPPSRPQGPRHPLWPVNRAPSCGQVSAPSPGPPVTSRPTGGLSPLPGPFHRPAARSRPGPARSSCPLPARPPQPPLLPVTAASASATPTAAATPTAQAATSQSNATAGLREYQSDTTYPSSPGRGRRRPIGQAARRRLEHDEPLIGCSGTGRGRERGDWRRGLSV